MKPKSKISDTLKSKKNWPFCYFWKMKIYHKWSLSRSHNYSVTIFSTNLWFLPGTRLHTLYSFRVYKPLVIINMKQDVLLWSLHRWCQTAWSALVAELWCLQSRWRWTQGETRWSELQTRWWWLSLQWRACSARPRPAPGSSLQTC